jgi:hypothetical protein
MMRFHPEMVAAFQAETGVDARDLDGADGEIYLRWVRFRAGFVTRILEELREMLASLPGGDEVVVSVRATSEGFLENLLQGMEVERWCEEGLIDRLHLDAMSHSAGGDCQDVRPYVELGRRTGVEIIGNVNQTTARRDSLAAALRRGVGLWRAGVDGIEIYESELLCNGYAGRWLFALLGHPERAERFLESSPLEACFPVNAVTALAGFDNHFGVIRHTAFDHQQETPW